MYELVSTTLRGFIIIIRSSSSHKNNNLLLPATVRVNMQQFIHNKYCKVYPVKHKKQFSVLKLYVDLI